MSFYDNSLGNRIDVFCVRVAVQIECSRRLQFPQLECVRFLRVAYIYPVYMQRFALHAIHAHYYNGCVLWFQRWISYCAKFYTAGEASEFAER